ncbi:MAG TPA: efflux RND transporter periplasmic adaptor subunit [Devosiaceae bacterium]|nr:efflux RND transporter periplasmic adaptor subunit [Devosiaceae bacterium]
MAVVLVAACVGGWFAWQHYLQATAPVVPETVAVTRSDVQQTVLANGILQANALVSVGAQVSGRVEKLAVKVGDVVKQGDLIAQIDSTDQVNAVKSAQAALAMANAQLVAQQATVKQAQAALDRINTLLKQGEETPADQETAQAALDTAKAQIDVIAAQIQQAKLNVDSANLNLSRTTITAPSAGTVVALLVDEGQTVNANQTAPILVKMADVSTMVIKAQISEADVPRVKPGQPVYFTILGEPDNKINAQLLSVDPAPDEVATDSDNSTPSTTNAIYYNGLFEVPNPDAKLRIDMTAQVTIVLADASNAITVPSSALTKTPRGGYLVAVYDPATGRVQPRRVTVGINNNVSAEILSGLKEGELVVATGLPALGPGGFGGHRFGGGQSGGPFAGRGGQGGQPGQGGNRPGGNFGQMGRGGPAGGGLLGL